MCKYNKDLIYQYEKEAGSFFQNDFLANMELRTFIDERPILFIYQ